MFDPVEEELIKVSGFEPAKSYKKRQDYLAALLNAVAEISNEDFDTLTDEAAEWANAAAKARKVKGAIPDFENSVSTDHDAEPETEEPDETKPKKARGKKRGTKIFDEKKSNLGTFDKYGHTMGTRSANVAAAFEEGVKMKDVKAQFGGQTFYNLLTRLEKAGHKVKRADDGIITLIHKDLAGD